MQRPETQRAGGRQAGPVLAVLQGAPSAAAPEQVPLRSALHEPLAGQTAKLVAMSELAPQVPPGGAWVSLMQRPVVVLQPTPLPRSHCSSAVHASPTWPATGAMQVLRPAGH